MNKIIKNGHEFLIHDSAWSHFWVSVESGEWEPYTFNIMDKFLSNDITYIDVGAWIGPTVMYASKLCKFTYAIEPDPVAYKQLCLNIELNKIQNIKMFNEAIMNYNGIITLGNDHNLGDSITRLRQTKNLFDVNCRTLDSFVKMENLKSPMFVKMDVEGSEEFILKSFDFFQKYKPILYISLYRNWFSDETEGMETIKKVGRLYNNCYDCNLNKVDLNCKCGQFVFID